MRWTPWIVWALAGCSEATVNPGRTGEPETDSGDSWTVDTGDADTGNVDTGSPEESDAPSDTDSESSDSEVGDSDESDTDDSGPADTDDAVDTDETGLFGGGGLTPSDMTCFVRPLAVERPSFRWLYDPSAEGYLPDVAYDYWDDREFILRDAGKWHEFEAIIGLDLPDPDFATEQVLASLYVANSTCGLTLEGAGVTEFASGDSLLQVSWNDASLGCDYACMMFSVGLAVVAVPREKFGHICQTVNAGCEGPMFESVY